MKDKTRSRSTSVRTTMWAGPLALTIAAFGMGACGGESGTGADDPGEPMMPSNNVMPPAPPPTPPVTPTPITPTPPAPVTPPPATEPAPMSPTPMEPAPMPVDPPPSGPFKSPVEGDDTFADLNREGPVITISGHQGYKGYKLMKWEENTKIDARTAVWDSYMACPSRATCNTVAKNSYPIQMGADWVDTFPLRVDLYNNGKCPDPVKEKLYWMGGVINGTTPLDISWDTSKHNNGGGMTMNAIGNVVDGVRLHNLHDGLLPLEGNNFVFKNSWVTYSHDDSIENDAFAGGLVEDNFFEGFFYFYSCTNTGGLDRQPNAYAPGGGPSAVVKFHNNLIAFKAMNGVDGQAWGKSLWKIRDGRAPKVEFVNNILYIPPKGRSLCVGSGGRAEGNVVVDMLGGCGAGNAAFKVMKGAEGQAFWDKALANWIARHPMVGRVKGDPGYDEFMATIPGAPASE